MKALERAIREASRQEAAAGKSARDAATWSARLRRLAGILPGDLRDVTMAVEQTDEFRHGTAGELAVSFLNGQPSLPRLLAAFPPEPAVLATRDHPDDYLRRLQFVPLAARGPGVVAVCPLAVDGKRVVWWSKVDDLSHVFVSWDARYVHRQPRLIDCPKFDLDRFDPGGDYSPPAYDVYPADVDLAWAVADADEPSLDLQLRILSRLRNVATAMSHLLEFPPDDVTRTLRLAEGRCAALMGGE